MKAGTLSLLHKLIRGSTSQGLLQLIATDKWLLALLDAELIPCVSVNDPIVVQSRIYSAIHINNTVHMVHWLQ